MSNKTTVAAPFDDDDDDQDLTRIKQFLWDADLKKAVTALSPREVRFLVSAYYMLQDNRKRSKSQFDRLEDRKQPNQVLGWLFQSSRYLEKQIYKALDHYSDNHPIGRWARSNYGIGPVIAAGLLSYVRMEAGVSHTAGQMFRFGGMDPTDKWLGQKGASDLIGRVVGSKKPATTEEHFVQIASAVRRKPEWVRERLANKTRKVQTDVLARRPWNAGFKTLIWKIGESFMKFSGEDQCYYGHIYVQRKIYEVERNESGGNKETAAKILAATPGHKQRDIYEQGKLPDGQLNARAKRYAAKLFLAHFWEKYYKHEFKKDPPLPWPIAFGGHAHYIPPPESKEPPQQQKVKGPKKPKAPKPPESEEPPQQQKAA
jgi:hypothetical protein